ncbi:MAG TPA: patatin-like phospholipase family protein, partial [Burkholderiales bacterium]|nr:patatin-like phospholipase family protein [Burkholderiales bacterium]
MTNNDPQGKRFPFRLCEVLEQEYVSLHQQQTWQADWLLHPGDVAVAKLTQRLRDAAHDLPMSPAHAIRQRLADTELDLAAEPDFAFEQRLLDALNALLRAERLLYDPGWLQPDSEAYRLSALRADEANEDSRPAMSDAAQQGASEHAQLNRLLLEAAFGPDLVARVDATRLTRLFERVHRLPPSGIMRSALCLSGGGIRSASFGVGALQALAAHGVLDKFDYLSTVSGGGYVGSWLSTWIYRHPQRLAGVTQALRASTQHEGSQWESKIEPEPDPIRFLRSYSHFLNPKAGVFTLDTWAWIGLYLRNLTLNWLIIIPLLLLLLLAPRVFAALAAVFAARSEPVDPWLFWCATLAGISVVLCAILNRPSATDPARRARQMPAVRPSQPRAVDKLLDRIKQPHWILALGVAPLLLFSTILALLVWGLPAGKTQLPLDALVRWIVTVPLFDLPSVLPVILLDNILVWGEGIILVAWLLSLALLPSGPWRMRVQELGAMLLAGALTWLIVSRLSIAFIGSTGDSARPMLSGTIYPLHLYAMLGVPGVVLAILAGMTLFIGIVSKKKWIDDEDREWWARFGAWILVATLSWVVLSAITLLGPLLLFEWPRLLGALGGLSGLAAVLLGKSALTPGPKSAGVESHNKLLAALGVNTTALLAALFLAVFLAALSLLTSGLLIALRASTSAWWTASAACAGQPVLSDAWQVLARAQVHTEVVCQTPLLDLLIALAVLAAIALIAAFNINLNKFSLHAAYRIRIA